MARKYIYRIEHSGDYAAGLRAYSEEVTIIVASGDPGGGESGEDSFQEFMRRSLEEWFDGARVQHLPN